MKFLVLSIFFAFEVYASNKVIYGKDNRYDLFQVSNPDLLQLASSTAAKIKNNRFDELSDGSYIITGVTLGKKKKLCKNERFYGQVTAASCTGFLVAPDLLVTAGHCIKSKDDCKSSKWVFGFSISEAENQVDKIKRENVYECTQVVEHKNDKNKNDYALVRLDREVVDRSPLVIRTEGKISSDATLLLIGHPTGLPTKIAPNAKVRSNKSSIYFTANTDSFGGNSGSPVLNQQTGIVEGILVRGDTDYTYDWNAKCRRPYRCPENLCRGEDVTRITNIEYLRY